MPKVPKISLHIFAISPWKHGDEVEFLSADKHKSHPQDGSIALGVISQTGPKYQKHQFTISLQCLKENMKEEVDILPADKRWRFFQIDTIVLGVGDQACLNYLK